MISSLNLKSDLSKSLIFHVVVVLSFLIKSWYTPAPLDFSSAIRVDMVGLPQKRTETQELGKPEAAAKPIAEVAKPKEKLQEKPPEKTLSKPKEVSKPEVVNLSKPAKPISKQQAALERLKALQQLENGAREESAKVAKGKAGTVPLAGNAVVNGNSIHGVQKLQYDAYIGDLDKQVKEHWELPRWLTNQDLHARAQMLIDDKGNVTHRRIVESSGNATYDSMVLKAIDSSSPFAPPPERFVDLLGSAGIVLGFPD